MASRPSNDQLRNELVRRGLPSSYIDRLLAELDDHFTDLVEERSSTMGAARKLNLESNDVQQQLGEPTQLAIFAAEQYHARSFWGRHPLVTFVFGPLPLLVACWTVTLLGIVWTGMSLAYVCEHWFGLSDANWEPKDHLWAQAIMMVSLTWFVIVVPPLSIAALLCRIARRNAVSWRWPIAGCTILAIVAGFVTVSYRLALARNEGQTMFGFNFDSSAQWLLVTYLPRFTVALVIGLLLVKRSQQKLELAT